MLNSKLCLSTTIAVMVTFVSTFSHGLYTTSPPSTRTQICSLSRIVMSSSTGGGATPSRKGKLLVLGGTGFLGQTVCKRAVLEGYQVTSLSRRGTPPASSDSIASTLAAGSIDYRAGDARKQESIANILQEGGYDGVVHCIGLLFDDESGLGNLNRFASGSGSLPDSESTYDSIIRLSALNAIEAVMDYAQKNQRTGVPFVFLSAAEAGWPDMPGGVQVEQFLAPDWLKRYLTAKRAVEAKLDSPDVAKCLRAIIPRPSLIYSLDRPASYLPVGAFFVGNKVGLPFVDRPVSVQSLANAIVKAVSQPNTRGILRYPQIDELSQ